MAKRKLVVQNVFSKGITPDPDVFFACVRAYIRQMERSRRENRITKKEHT